MKTGWEGKVVLITGSARGIGAACAKLVKGYGAEVILHGHTESDHLKKIAKELSSKYIFCDISDAEAVKMAVDDLIKHVERIDCLINCAGWIDPKYFPETTDSDWLEDYKINFLGVVHFCQVILPLMKKQGYGRVVNVSSSRGHSNLASNRSIAYSSSKAAVINLTASLAKEYAPEVLVNSVSPSFTETDMSNTWTERTRQNAATALLGRPAQPEEMAEPILFLASEKNTFITGQDLLIDGGYATSGK